MPFLILDFGILRLASQRLKPYMAMQHCILEGRDAAPLRFPLTAKNCC